MSGHAAPDWTLALEDGAEDEHLQEPTTFVTFELSDQLFAVDVAFVREILDRQAITPMPNAPGDVEGMIDVRGRSVAVVDLSARLGVARRADSEETRIIVFEFFRKEGEPALPLGVRADHVRKVSQIPDEEIEPAPRADGAWSADLMRGVARSEEGMVVILDMNSVFPPGERARGDFDFG